MHECYHESGDECPADASVPAVDNRYSGVGRGARRSSRVFDIFSTLWERTGAVLAYAGGKCFVVWVGVDIDENCVLGGVLSCELEESLL